MQIAVMYLFVAPEKGGGWLDMGLWPFIKNKTEVNGV
jgi:hypothetical protein